MDYNEDDFKRAEDEANSLTTDEAKELLRREEQPTAD